VAYAEVLGMLRELDRGGAWPSTSKRRQELIRPRAVTQVFFFFITLEPRVE